MKKFSVLLIAIIFLTGCTIGTVKSSSTVQESNDLTEQSDEISEGVNFKDKTLGQILPNFPEDIITLTDKQELNALSHLYFFPEDNSLNITGDKRDTCYTAEYTPNNAEEAFNQYQDMFNAKPDEDPDQFDTITGDYFIRIRINPAAFMLYIYCYTHLDEEYKEAKLDEVVSKYSPQELIKNYLRKVVMILPESKSYVFGYDYDGDDERVIEFYRNLIPNCKEETRNDVTYIEDSVIGTEIGQFITINSKLKTVNVQEVTYQQW